MEPTGIEPVTSALNAALSQLSYGPRIQRTKFPEPNSENQKSQVLLLESGSCNLVLGVSIIEATVAHHQDKLSAFEFDAGKILGQFLFIDLGALFITKLPEKPG